MGVLAHDQRRSWTMSSPAQTSISKCCSGRPVACAGSVRQRPHVGITLSSEGTSLAYAGLTWEHNFRSGWFLDGSVGLAVHDGERPRRKNEQTLEEAETEKAMGCRLVFHLGVSAGYRISPHWNVAAHYEHLSNGTICGGNEGLENIGIRVSAAGPGRQARPCRRRAFPRRSRRR